MDTKPLEVGTIASIPALNVIIQITGRIDPENYTYRTRYTFDEHTGVAHRNCIYQ